MRFDVCNGDADGLCSVVQWRLFEPRVACLVIGLKRDIALLERVRAVGGDEVLVCDLSMPRNLSALTQLLDAGVAVRYFDHHKVDRIPAQPLLNGHIDTASDTCTSRLEQETVEQEQELEALRHDDMRRARLLPAYLEGARFSIHVFPNAPWSRRVSGCWSNHLASAQPLQAHALLTSTASGDYKVSVRAPLCAPIAPTIAGAT
jgi:hypothetical protein